jgi:hypothetical protein
VVAACVYGAWTVFLVGLCIRVGGETCEGSAWLLLFSGLPSSIPFAFAFGRCRPFDLAVLGLAGGTQWTVVTWAIVGLVRRIKRSRGSSDHKT